MQKTDQIAQLLEQAKRQLTATQCEVLHRKYLHQQREAQLKSKQPSDNMCIYLTSHVPWFFSIGQLYNGKIKQKKIGQITGKRL